MNMGADSMKPQGLRGKYRAIRMNASKPPFRLAPTIKCKALQKRLPEIANLIGAQEEHENTLSAALGPKGLRQRLQDKVRKSISRWHSGSPYPPKVSRARPSMQC